MHVLDILIITPLPLTATSFGLSTGIAPVPKIKGPTMGLLQLFAAAIKLIGLLSMAISN